MCAKCCSKSLLCANRYICMYVCKYNSYIKASKCFKLNWNFDYEKWVFFLKSNMQIIQIHLLQQVTMPKLSLFPFVSVQFSTNVQITKIWGYWRCEQGILRCRLTPHELQRICDIIVACLLDFPSTLCQTLKTCLRPTLVCAKVLVEKPTMRKQVYMYDANTTQI